LNGKILASVAPGPRVNMAAENVKVWHLCEVNKVNYNILRRDV